MTREKCFCQLFGIVHQHQLHTLNLPDQVEQPAFEPAEPFVQGAFPGRHMGSPKHRMI